MAASKIEAELKQLQDQISNCETYLLKQIKEKKKPMANHSEISTQTQDTPIAIVGMACIFPQAGNLEEYWQNIIQEVDCITDVPPSRWDIDDYYDPNPKTADKTHSKRGGFIPGINFNPVEFGLPPNILEVTDISQLLSLVVAGSALADAGYKKREESNHHRTGVILGVAAGRQLAVSLGARLQYPVWEKVLKNSGLSDEQTQNIVERIKNAYVGWNENAFPGMLANVIAGRIANRFNLEGMNCVVDAACASSLAAVQMAVTELATRRADVMLTGGVDTDNSIMAYMCFSKTPAVSSSLSSKPFDASADGMILGEGIGMLVLKRLEDAERDKNKIYGVIKGVGASSDGRHRSIYAPRSEGQVTALRRAYEAAQCLPGSVGLVEAHGTGTIAGDSTEITSMMAVFGENNHQGQYIALGSVKSQIGHTKAAAGAAGLIKAALALHHKILPPTINISEPNSKLTIKDSPFYLNTHTRPWISTANQPRRAGVSAFGFGGTNYHVVLEEYKQEHSKPYRVHSTPGSILICSQTREGLLSRCGEIQFQLQSVNREKYYQSLVAESKVLKVPTTYPRVGLVVNSCSEAGDLLEKFVDFLATQPSVETWQHQERIYYRFHGMEKHKKVVALFTGQGSQYLDMGKELTINFPGFRQIYTEIDQLLTGSKLQPISSVVFPPPALDSGVKTTQKEILQKTQYAQLAIAAFSSGLYQLLQQAGFKPDFLAGHSFGELTALWAAGVMSQSDYYRLAKARGLAMAVPENSELDRGTMLAVKGDFQAIKQAIAPFPAITIANFNSCQQLVIAGTTADINAITPLLNAHGFHTVPLPVAAAFHTSLVGYARQAFTQALENININSPKTPVYTNFTATPYPPQPKVIKNILSEHLVNPVLFQQQIENIYAEGGYCFVEIGPRNILTKLVTEILGERSHLAIPLNSHPHKDSDRSLREAIIQLRVAGVPLTDPDSYSIPATIPPLKTPSTVVLTGINYTSPQLQERQQQINNQQVTMNNLQQTLTELNHHQNQVLQLHQQYLTSQQQYTQQVLQLLQQHQVPTEKDLLITIDNTPQPPAIPEPPSKATEPNTNSTTSSDSLDQTLLNIVSDKTGYPVEMLEMSMDIEADLGIDSIKRVEILSALLETQPESHPDSSPPNPEELAQLRTLQEIVHYIQEKINIPPQTTATTDTIHPRLIELQPLPLPDTLETTIPPNHIALITDDHSPVTTKLAEALDKKGWKTVILSFPPKNTQNNPELDNLNRVVLEYWGEENLQQQLQSIASEHGSIGAFIHLHPSEPPDSLTEKNLLSHVFLIAKYLKQPLNQAAQQGQAYFLTVTHLDGQLGLGQEINPSLIAAGLLGLTKTLKQEWTNVFCRSLDISPHLDSQTTVQHILAELHDPNNLITEIGYTPDQRTTLTTTPQLNHIPVKNSSSLKDQIFLVSGGAKGITAQCVIAIAQKYQCKFILLGRSTFAPEPDWSIKLTEPSQLKQEIITRNLAKNIQPTPAQIEKELQPIISSREIAATLQAIKQAGGEARYICADITNQIHLTQELKNITDQSGLITGIIHGAGNLADKLIHKKTLQDFELVYNPKVDGLENLLQCIPPEQLQYLILFSSVVGVYGNPGQTDYAIANEILNKTAHTIKRKHPHCHTLAINWGPWETGMVTPVLKKAFSERHIKTIPIQTGTQIFIQQLQKNHGQPQIIIGNPIIPPPPPLNPELKTIRIHRQLSLAANPFLIDHVIAGKPVLPATCALNWIVNACEQLHPGYLFFSCKDFKVLKGIVFDDHTPQKYTLELVETAKTNEIELKAQIISNNSGVLRYHFSAEIQLTREIPPPPFHSPTKYQSSSTLGQPYDQNGTSKLFHGSSFQGIKTILELSPQRIVTKCKLPNLDSSKQGQFPVQSFNPYIVDVQIQSLWIWSQYFYQTGSLPAGITKFEQFAPLPFDQEFYICSEIKSKSESIVTANIITHDVLGKIYCQMTQARGTLLSRPLAKA
ncbi:KR domain-containing protein [Chrysosporum bergii ANA360D]|uniref:KR domain-containing protein n=1 Tax=Chrysosporum bergii ANA360D TaxID=617107 RepID=A0AA43KCQ8_9CYAN|nr:type I polyketide synthase [Chrysosporum bergii]MDH6061213.1 KR domain-containing protein [Chrysosporum bergii ANA360D]